MNTLKTVFGKLFKEETTNLATHEIHLSLLDEIKKITDLYKKKIGPDYDSIEKERSKIAGEIVALKKKSEIAYKLWEETKKVEEPLAKKFAQQAKELGLDPFKIKEYDEYNTQYDNNFRAYKTYEYIKDIKLP
jgi:hypothetical protein